jgi:putative transposase
MTTDTTITPELLDRLLANYTKPEDLTGENGLFKKLKKALIERALGAELTEHLGYEKGDPGGRGSGNSRNGTSSKMILIEDGGVEISIPRDRAGSFEPQLIAKGQTHFDGLRRQERAVAHARRRFKRENGRFWRAHFVPKWRARRDSNS